MNESQRAMVAARIANMGKHDNQYTSEVRSIDRTSTPPISQAKAAEMLNAHRFNYGDHLHSQSNHAAPLASTEDICRNPTVASIRLNFGTSEDTPIRTVTRGDQTYTIDTSNIGKRREGRNGNGLQTC